MTHDDQRVIGVDRVVQVHIAYQRMNNERGFPRRASAIRDSDAGLDVSRTFRPVLGNEYETKFPTCRHYCEVARGRESERRYATLDVHPNAGCARYGEFKRVDGDAHVIFHMNCHPFAHSITLNMGLWVQRGAEVPLTGETVVAFTWRDIAEPQFPKVTSDWVPCAYKDDSERALFSVGSSERSVHCFPSDSENIFKVEDERAAPDFVANYSDRSIVLITVVIPGPAEVIWEVDEELGDGFVAFEHERVWKGGDAGDQSCVEQDSTWGFQPFNTNHADTEGAGLIDESWKGAVDVQS